MKKLGINKLFKWNKKKQFGVIFFLIDRERIEKVGHFYRKLRYSQMHSNPGATLKIPGICKNKFDFMLKQCNILTLYCQNPTLNVIKKLYDCCLSIYNNVF